MTSPWQRTWSPAHEETFPLVHCWQQPLWRTYVCERVTKPWKLKPDVPIISASTEMSDELLSDLHPLQQLLQETISEPLLNGGDVGLHVFEAPENEVSVRELHVHMITVAFFTFNNWMISDSICCRNVVSNSLQFVSKSLILLQETINLQVLRTKVQHLEFRQYRVTAYPFSCRNLSSSYAFSRSRAFSFAVSVS